MLIAVKTPPCIVCGETSRVPVLESDYYRWTGGYDKPGVLIQEAFPYLDEDQRELLMTGTHPVCWDKFIEDVEGEANNGGALV